MKQERNRVGAGVVDEWSGGPRGRPPCPFAHLIANLECQKPIVTHDRGDEPLEPSQVYK